LRFADLPADVEAIQPRQADIKQTHLRPKGRRGGDRGRAFVRAEKLNRRSYW